MTAESVGSRTKAVARDLVVLVAGILLALAGDAWWDGVQERGVETDYLESVRDDLSQMATELDRAIAADSASVAGNLRLVEAMRVGAGGGALSFRFEDVSFSIGTIQALVGSGDIRVISSTQLRAEIVALHAMFDSRTAWNQSLEAQLLENLRESVRASEAERGPDGLSVPTEAGRNPDFVATVINYGLLLGARVSSHRRLRVAVEDLRAAVEQELTMR